METETVLYFAYGSNADPERFRDRVGPWRTRAPATLPDHRLRFASAVRSEGGGGAVVDPAPGASVDGVVFEITPDQLRAMDREEFDPERDTRRLGRRIRRRVRIGGREADAELYTIDGDDGGWCAPSSRYLGHILRGLEDAGCPAAALDRVRDAARRAADPANVEPAGSPSAARDPGSGPEDPECPSS